MTLYHWSKAIKQTLPIAMGYYAAAIAYGVLATAAGLPTWLVIGMSFFIYGGAVQYAAIPLFVSNAGILSLVISTFLISFRQIFYTIAIRADLPKPLLQRLYTTGAMTDESFSLLMTQKPQDRRNNALISCFLIQFYWVSASIIGAILGSSVAGFIPHLDFALPCLFVILAYEQYIVRKKMPPIFIALFSFIMAKLLLPDLLLLSAIVFCIFVILLQYQFEGKSLASSE